MATVTTPMKEQRKVRTEAERARHELTRDRLVGAAILVFYLAIIGMIVWFASGSTIPAESIEPFMFW